MKDRTLLERIKDEIGISISVPGDDSKLAGMFNRYRPNGLGLERLLLSDGVEGEVLSRIRRVFGCTARCWRPSDFYFVIRNFDVIDQSKAEEIASLFLSGVGDFIRYIGDVELSDEIDQLRVVPEVGDNAEVTDDFFISIYECLTDFFAGLQSDFDEIFFLKEAVYSMANDYFLMAYLMLPAAKVGALEGSLNAYYDVWRYGLKLEYFSDGSVVVKRPEVG